MAKMVGYACNVKATWMKQARLMLADGLSEKEYKEKLNEYLAFEIDSPIRLRKSREILMHTWFYADENIDAIRKEALRLIDKYPDYETAIGMCLIYFAYPVVADISKLIGRLLDYQDYFTNGVLKQKLYDEWGERGSLETTSRRVTLTMKDMGLLTCEARTHYKPVITDIKAEEVVSFLLFVGMKLDGSSYYPFSGLNGFKVLFPFRYTVTKEQLLNDDRFVLSNFDGQLSVALKQ